MSQPSAPAKPTHEVVLERFDAKVDEITKSFESKLADQEARHAKELDEVKKSVATPQRGDEIANFYAAIGGIPKDSEGYSICKAARFAAGRATAEECKYELDVSRKLADIYKSMGWRASTEGGLDSRLMVPFSTKLLPRETSEAERLVVELKHKMVAGADRVDPDEVGWIRKRMGIDKALGTLTDTAGGTLVGFPTLGELIDLQRNVEAFAQAGATDVALPANGRIQYPKLTNATSAFWVGEGVAGTTSNPSTGYLDLTPKKLVIITDLNNELLRFGTISAEAMVRTDMAKVAALKLDLAMLEGTGGTQIKGLITYDSASTWTPGTDKLIAYTVTSNLLQVKDAAEMEALLPDTAGEPTAWIMRRQLFAKLRNRRADSVTVTDGAGPFLANLTRSLSERLPYQWDGTKVIRSSQVSATRGNGSQTYALLGYFPDWLIGRFGALEFLSSQVGDTQMLNDQFRLRALQHVDAGARHASSFVFADAITIS